MGNLCVLGEEEKTPCTIGLLPSLSSSCKMPATFVLFTFSPHLLHVVFEKKGEECEDQDC